MRILENGIERNATEAEIAEHNAAQAAAGALPKPGPESISDRQFFQQLAIEDKITEAEAIAAVATGTIPEAMDGLIEMLPQAQRFPARMLVSGATTFLRSHPVTNLIGQLYGFPPDEVDRIWREAAEL